MSVGTLVGPDSLPPDAHIYTASKQPWGSLPPGVPAFAESYDAQAIWPADSLARRATLYASLARRRGGALNARRA